MIRRSAARSWGSIRPYPAHADSTRHYLPLPVDDAARAFVRRRAVDPREPDAADLCKRRVDLGDETEIPEL